MGQSQVWDIAGPYTHSFVYTLISQSVTSTDDISNPFQEGTVVRLRVLSSTLSFLPVLLPLFFICLYAFLCLAIARGLASLLEIWAPLELLLFNHPRSTPRQLDCRVHRTSRPHLTKLVHIPTHMII